LSETDPTEQGGIPPSLGSAADELRTNVERQVREIVESAERRAEEIEAAALRRARESEAAATLRARRVFVEAEQRASSLLASLDVLETRIGSAIADMRRAGEALAGEIRGAIPEAGPEISDPELREQLLGESSAAPPDGGAELPSSEEAVREHLVKMREEGKSRPQAARSLLEFSKDGGAYRAILDEVYPEPAETEQKRGLLRKRRSGRPQPVE
jgi:hypothetical protein